MAATNDDLIGKVLDGKYHILELLGQGGMGTVYKALHVFLQTIVVIKVVRADPALLVTRQGIEREARILSTLHHRNIIEIYEVGVADDRSYLAMEYIEGPSLRQILAEGKPLGVDYAIEIVSQVGTGLDYAHSKSILHRDIKPSNILIGSDGRVVLTDFGLALVPGQSTLTAIGMVLGTPTYMSPEHARAERLDARSDIYSLGIVLFELLTGQPPFRGETPLEMFVQRINQVPPSPRELNPTVPFIVEQIVLRALATNPDERYQTAQELVQDLTNATRPVSLSSPSIEKPDLEAPIAAKPSFPGFAREEFTAVLTRSAGIPRRAWILSGVLFFLFFVTVFFWTFNRSALYSPAPASDLPGSSGPLASPGSAVLPWYSRFLVPSFIILLTAAAGVWLLVRIARTTKSQSTTLSNESMEDGATLLVDETTMASQPYRESPVASTIINREASTMGLLQVLNGPQRGRQFRLDDSVIVGRGSHCDVALNDPRVSRTHAEVFLKDDRFHVYDLGSQGGIFVNELRVAEQELRDRDEIRIGDTIIMFIQVISPGDQTVEAKRRVREFDVIWKELSRAARRD